MVSSLRHAGRLLRAGFLLARYDVLIPKEFAKDLPEGTRRGTKFIGALARATVGRKARRESLETRISKALVRLGPAYVKFGQIAATRGDIVGPQLAEALGILQDDLPAFPMKEAQQIVEDALGAPLQTLYVSFSEPIAAASVAQVHRAKILDEDGPRTVAVKILRPGIEEILKRDLEAFHWAARLAYRLFPKVRRLEPVKFVEVLEESVKLELDLRTEAAAASELREMNDGRPGFRVPEVDWDRTTRRVLTMSWVDGISLKDGPALLEAGYDVKRLGTHVVQVFMEQALMDGFFHADMHPGNLFAFNASGDAGGEEGFEPGIAAVDFGIMGRLDGETQHYLADILWGFLVADYDGIAAAHIDAGYVPRGANLKDFSQALRAIGEPLLGRTASDINMARLLQQLLQTTERFDMHMQPQLVLLQKTMVVVEGVARELDPDYDMWETARPVIERFMETHKGPEAKLRSVAEGALSLLDTLRKAPEILAESARQVEALGEITADGLRLHPETVAALAAVEVERARTARRWWLAGAAALLVLAWLIAGP